MSITQNNKARYRKQASSNYPAVKKQQSLPNSELTEIENLLAEYSLTEYSPAIRIIHAFRLSEEEVINYRLLYFWFKISEVPNSDDEIRTEVLALIQANRMREDYAEDPDREGGNRLVIYHDAYIISAKVQLRKFQEAFQTLNISSVRPA